MQLAETMWRGAAAETWRTLLAFLDPEKRVFWPFLLSAAAIALAVAWLQAPADRRRPAALARWLLAPAIWWHPSSRLDLRLLLARAVLRALLVAPWMVSAVAVARWVTLRLDGLLGADRVEALPGPAVTALYTLALFIGWDLSRYLLHRAAHEIPLLWRFHQVHHSAEVMTPWTLYRSHPVEGLLFTLRGVAVTGALTGLFWHLFGIAALQAEIWGVNALVFLANLAGGNLRHSHVWWSFGPRVERWLLSPAQHQLHHSVDPRHYHHNFGVWIAVWDRLGGSLLIAGNRPRRLRFGLPDGDRNHDPRSLWSALIDPLRRPRRPAAGSAVPR